MGMFEGLRREQGHRDIVNYPMELSLMEGSRISDVAKRRRHEPTQPRNPHRLTIGQHIHSRACVARFADTSGRVAVVRRGNMASSFPASPDNSIFCAKRVWDQRVEHGLFCKIEAAFQEEVESILQLGTVRNHRAVTAYVSIWQIRAQLAERPPKDVVLHGIPSERLTKDQEEILERKHGAFTRGGSLAGRFAASVDATRGHDIIMSSVGDARWGVLRATEGAGFVCPGSPSGELYIPVTPTLALITRYRDRALTRANVDDVNLSLLAKKPRLIFGHPTDVAAFLARVQAAAGAG